jgi:hypothetical protein
MGEWLQNAIAVQQLMSENVRLESNGRMAYKVRTNEKSTLNRTAAISALGAMAATAMPIKFDPRQ